MSFYSTAFKERTHFFFYKSFTIIDLRTCSLAILIDAVWHSHIIDWLRLEGTLKITYFQASAIGRAAAHQIPPCPITIRPCKKSVSLLLVSSLQVLESRKEVSWEPSLLKLNKPTQSKTRRNTGLQVIFTETLWKSMHVYAYVYCCAHATKRTV